MFGEDLANIKKHLPKGISENLESILHILSG